MTRVMEGRMRIRVVGRTGVVAGHRLRLPGEVFEVKDAMGMALLAQYGPQVERAGVSAVPAEVAAANAPTPAATVPLPMPVATLALSQRVLDALAANDIETVSQLRSVAGRGDEAMLALQGIGRRALTEIMEALAVAEPGADLP